MQAGDVKMSLTTWGQSVIDSNLQNNDPSKKSTGFWCETAVQDYDTSIWERI